MLGPMHGLAHTNSVLIHDGARWRGHRTRRSCLARALHHAVYGVKKLRKTAIIFTVCTNQSLLYFSLYKWILILVYVIYIFVLNRICWFERRNNEKWTNQSCMQWSWNEIRKPDSQIGIPHDEHTASQTCRNFIAGFTVLRVETWPKGNNNQNHTRLPRNSSTPRLPVMTCAQICCQAVVANLLVLPGAIRQVGLEVWMPGMESMEHHWTLHPSKPSKIYIWCFPISFGSGAIFRRHCGHEKNKFNQRHCKSSWKNVFTNSVLDGSPSRTHSSNFCNGTTVRPDFSRALYTT